MRLMITKIGLDIFPETDQDHAFIRDTLRLEEHGQVCELIREDKSSKPGSILRLTTIKRPHYKEK